MEVATWFINIDLDFKHLIGIQVKQVEQANMALEIYLKI